MCAKLNLCVIFIVIINLHHCGTPWKETLESQKKGDGEAGGGGGGKEGSILGHRLSHMKK